LLVVQEVAHQVEQARVALETRHLNLQAKETMVVTQTTPQITTVVAAAAVLGRSVQTELQVLEAMAALARHQALLVHL
jgi:uncharacterized protein YaaN involved in tellurite resistance